MRTFDFAPLHRATIGFDQIDSYRISIAVAGFSEDDLNVEVKENALVVAAKKAEDGEDRSFLHRGIATRAFERRFTLADHVRVTGASHENGMLHIDLHREVPEALKPRRIEISSSRSNRAEIEAKAVN
ncbi:Hsp20 family protein [Leisingera sp. F5]|uniref:Hsp20 family protein n=1 Tax=Leisingera sp. F5 TaxID=1813816 RepID=UPI000A7D75FA|nr:Hsp20 family protein [Leisingera sp. F5]